MRFAGGRLHARGDNLGEFEPLQGHEQVNHRPGPTTFVKPAAWRPYLVVLGDGGVVRAKRAERWIGNGPPL